MPAALVVPKAEAASEVREPETMTHKGCNLVFLPSPRKPGTKRRTPGGQEPKETAPHIL